MWWALGTASLIWIPVGVVLFVRLFWMPRVLAPGGYGLWILFLLWMGASGLQLDGAGSVVAFMYRFALYATAGTFLVYAFNFGGSQRMVRLVVSGVASLWILMVVLGTAALAAPDVNFRSLLEVVLPRALVSIEFVRQLVHPALAQQQDFLGYVVARPSAPFTYTNEWGSALAITAPVYLLWVTRIARGWWRTTGWILLAVALVPIVFSLNRGLWLSLVVGSAYLVVFLAVRGRPRGILIAAAVVGVLMVAFSVTDLGALTADRLDNGHSDERRLTLYERSIDGIIASPFVGYGGTQRAAGDTADRAPVGTHGQIWLVAFSHGLPAAALFTGFLLVLWFKTARVHTALALYAHVMVAIALTQLSFYSLLPAQLPLVFLISGLALGEARMTVPPTAVVAAAAV